MGNRFKRIGIVLACCLFLCSVNAYAINEKDTFNMAVDNALNDSLDFAFIDFHSIVKESYNSKYYKDSLFAVGEYYFDVGDYYDAGRVFSEYIEKYCDSKAVPFALVYLLKIGKGINSSVVPYLEKDIIESRQLSLLFSEYKENSYLSPMQKKYRVLYFIDRVEFYINGELFEKILY